MTSTATPEPAITDSRSLAAQLPPTILSPVFELLRDACEQEGSLGWLSVSHVCRQWRSNALGNPALWASLNPIVLSRGLLDTFLERSEDAPLDILVDSLANNRDDRALRDAYKKVLSTQLHRVRSLVYPHTDIQWQIVPAAEELATLFNGPAPLLQTLKLPAIKRSKFLFRESSVLSSFLTNHAPGLRHLEIGRFPPGPFPWGPSSPSAIRTLVLSADTSIEGYSAFTFSELLDGLRAMPILQILSLSGVVPKHAPDSAQEDVVHLPRLQKLHLIGSGIQYALLWYRLKLHPECAVRIEIVRSLDFPAILPVALEKHCTECDISSLTEIHIKRNTANGVAYDLYPLGQPPDEGEPPSRPYTHPSLSLFIAWENRVEKAPHMPALQIFFATPLSNVKRVTIQAIDAGRTQPEHMASLDRRGDAVEDLTLVGYRPPQLSSMFLLLGGTLRPRSSDDGDGLFFMPRLRTVTLEQGQFDRDVATPALRDALERRVRCGVPSLEVLSLVGCELAGRLEELEVEFVESGLIRCIRCEDDAGVPRANG